MIQEFVEMKDQKRLILNADWDYLFILDACRYDYSKWFFSDYLNGRLYKAKSPGSTTPEWAKKLFLDRSLQDIVYISGNPWMNSVLPKRNFFLDEKIDMTDTFYEIVDVWDFGWWNGTVLPVTMLESLRRAEEVFPGKKKIIHFNQPHAPYLRVLDKSQTIGDKLVDLAREFRDKLQGSPDSDRDFRSEIGKFLFENFGNKFTVALRSLFGLDPRLTRDVLYKFGKIGLKKLYVDNLRRALFAVKKSLSFLEGEIIISSDHGEFLGEKLRAFSSSIRKEIEEISGKAKSGKRWIVELEGEALVHSHPYYVDHPSLRVVPWFKVEGSGNYGRLSKKE